MPAPMMLIRKIANRNPGKAVMTSTRRVTTKSKRPPRSAASAPSGTPMPKAMSCTEKPMNSDVRAP